MKIKALIFLFLSALFLYRCDSNPYRQGHILYDNFCSNCHMEDGSGLEGLIPPLAGADYLRDNPLRVPCFIRYGQKGEIVVNGKTYNQEMVPIPQLSHIEITNVINFINHAWGNDFGYVKFEDVRRVLEECKE